MILERIAVSQFQRHLMPAALSFADRGVTLVEGPNEAGKSTMFRALREAFLRNCGSTASVVKKFQPWNGAGNLAPEVTVDFTFEGKYYRLVKRWGARKEALLYRYPTPERVGNDAKLDADPDEFLAHIFAAKSGSTTALTAPQLGLMHLLFAPQGRVRLDDAEGLGDTARLRLADIIGVAAESGAETAVVRKIKREYETLYTPKGKLKSGASSSALAEDLRQTQGALAEARAEAAGIEALRTELDEVLQRVAVSAERYEAAKQRQASEVPRLFDAQRIKHRLDGARQELQMRARTYDELVDAAKMLEDLQARAAGLQQRLTAAQERMTAAATAADAAEEQYAAATAAANRAAGEDPEIVRLQSEHDSLAQILRRQGERDRLADDVRRLGEADAAIAQMAAELAEMRAVPPGAVERAQSVQAELVALNARIEAAQLVMSVTASTPFEATVTANGATSHIALGAGQNAVLRSDGTLEIALPNATMTIRGPVADLSADTARLATLRETLAEIAAEFGTHDPLVLSQMADRRAAAERRLNEQKTQRTALLAGSSAQELRARLDVLHATLPEPAVGEDAVSALKLQLDERRSQIDALRAQMRSEREIAQAADRAAREQRDEARTALGSVREELSSIEGKLAMVPGAADSADTRRERQSQAYAQREEARNALAALESAYEPYAGLGDPDEQLKVLEKAVEEAQHLLAQHKDAQLRIETTLQTKRESGLASRVPLLEAQQSTLERDLRHARAAEHAVQLLHTTIDARLQQRNTMLAGPVIPIVCEWYRLVTGKQIAELNIDTKAAVAGMRFVDCDADVHLDDLSSGAADQLCLLIRLAYAKVLADYNASEPMPVLLDDVLVNCDEQRRRRMIEIVNRVAQQTQVIILTCDPSPYLGQGWTIASLESAAEMRDFATG